MVEQHDPDSVDRNVHSLAIHRAVIAGLLQFSLLVDGGSIRDIVCVCDRNLYMTNCTHQTNLCDTLGVKIKGAANSRAVDAVGMYRDEEQAQEEKDAEGGSGRRMLLHFIF